MSTAGRACMAWFLGFEGGAPLRRRNIASILENIFNRNEFAGTLKSAGTDGLTPWYFARISYLCLRVSVCEEE